VSTGKPDLPGNFDDVMVDGIKVYIYKGAVASPDGIKISLEGDWALFHNLKAEGLIFEQPVAG
jgi:hypothetical protein